MLLTKTECVTGVEHSLSILHHLSAVLFSNIFSSLPASTTVRNPDVILVLLALRRLALKEPQKLQWKTTKHGPMYRQYRPFKEVRQHEWQRCLLSISSDVASSRIANKTCEAQNKTLSCLGATKVGWPFKSALACLIFTVLYFLVILFSQTRPSCASSLLAMILH